MAVANESFYFGQRKKNPIHLHLAGKRYLPACMQQIDPKLLKLVICLRAMHCIRMINVVVG